MRFPVFNKHSDSLIETGTFFGESLCLLFANPGVSAMRIAVIGDAMIDVDISCETVKRYGDAPVLRETSRTERPGGAANVAEMCLALGSKALLFCNNKQAIIKRRFLVNGKTVFRHDTETIQQYKWADVDLHRLHEFSPNAIIIADHGKGFVTEDLMKSLPEIPIFIDPVSTTFPINGDNVTWVGSESEIPNGSSGRKIIKKGKEGGVFINADGNFWQFVSECRNCTDDIGAGDQFIASLAVYRLCGLGWFDSVGAANKDAGEQCERAGIQPITKRRI